MILAKTAESLARTARELKGMSPDVWLTFEEAAAYLKKTPKVFEKVVAKRDPKTLPDQEGVFFSPEELDGWLIGR